jgi:hypothetical protein
MSSSNATDGDMGVAGALAMGMSDASQTFFDWWPNICAGTSLLCCIFSAYANFMQRNESGILQTVFAMVCLTTAGVMVALLTSFRFSGATQDDQAFAESGCQFQGAVAVFFQLASAFWMAAGSLYTILIDVIS